MNVPTVEESALCYLVLVKLVWAVMEKAHGARRRLILRVASVHVDDKAVAGVLAVILQDALHVKEVTSEDFRTLARREWIISRFWREHRPKTGDYPLSW